MTQKELKAAYTEELKKAWNDDEMVKYCSKSTAKEDEIKEENTMKFETMQSEIIAKWSEHFNGKCDVEICRVYGRFILIEMRLSEKIDICRENDIFQIRFMIDLPDNFNESENLPKNLTITSNARDYKIKPKAEKIKYLVYEYRRVPFREVTGTPEKIIQVIGKFIDKLYKQFTADYKNGNITNNYIEIVKENLK